MPFVGAQASGATWLDREDTDLGVRLSLFVAESGGSALADPPLVTWSDSVDDSNLPGYPSTRNDGPLYSSASRESTKDSVAPPAEDARSPLQSAATGGSFDIVSRLKFSFSPARR